MRRTATWALLTGALALAAAAPAAAHVHHVNNPNHDQTLANDQNHPGFVFDGTYFQSCGQTFGQPGPAGTNGPAGYGLETAHHGPDADDPGKDDGCYANDAPPLTDDQNPAID